MNAGGRKTADGVPQQRRWISGWLRLLTEAGPVDAKVEPARQLAEQAGEWDALASAVIDEHLTSAAVELLGRLPREAVPEHARSRINERWRRLQVRTLMLETALHRTGLRLADRGVRFAVIKGPALSVQLYGKSAKRDYLDLDLLVPPRHQARAAAVLADMGYAAYGRPAPRRRRSTLRAGSSVSLIGPDRTCVDLHWGLGGRAFRFDLEGAGLWERTQPLQLGGRTYEGLGAEDTLVYLCAHGGKHRWERWSWIGDLARLVSESANLDIRLLRMLAAKTGSARMVGVGLLLAHDPGGVRLPPELAAIASGDGRARELASQIRSALMAGAIQDVNPWRRLAWRLQLRERTQDRAWDLLGWVLELWRPPIEEPGVEPPTRVGPFTRLLRLAWKHRTSWRTRRAR